MKSIHFNTFFIILILVSASLNLTFAGTHEGYLPNSLAPVSNIFMQTNNINTVFRSDGIFNYDKITYAGTIAGLIWPVTAASRLSIDYSTGLWIGTKYGAQRELRTAVSLYNSTFSPGNIPVLGQVPPNSVCSDPSFKEYLVSLADQNLINGGTVSKIAGGHTYIITYDAWSSWPVDKGAPYVEVNGIPGYQPGWNADRPGIGETTARPTEIIFSVFMDYTYCTNNIHAHEVSLPGGTLPMGAEIQQISFSYNLPGMNDMYFMKWRIFNKSASIWDSTYICLVDDGDIGDGADDAAGCDTARQTGFIYNGDNNDADYGANPPAIGYRMLQGPLKYTGNLNDTARLPYGNFPGYKLLGMTGYNVFTNVAASCSGDPDNAAAGFNFMRGKDGCGNPIINYVTSQQTTFKYSGDAVNHIGWYDSSVNDRRQILSSGPITMNPGDQQVIVTGIVIGRSSSNLQSIAAMLSLSDSARRYYNQSFFGTPLGVLSISSEVPKSFALNQNYPNPFNPSTKIKFAVPRSANATITIYDALGRQVAMLVNERLKPGTYETEWDGSNFASGIYFYTLSADEFTQTKKLVLLK